MGFSSCYCDCSGFCFGGAIGTSLVFDFFACFLFCWCPMPISAPVATIIVSSPISGNGIVACGIFANISVIVMIVFSGRSAIGETAIATGGTSNATMVPIAPNSIASGMSGSTSMFDGIPTIDTSPIVYARYGRMVICVAVTAATMPRISNFCGIFLIFCSMGRANRSSPNVARNDRWNDTLNSI